MRLRLGTLKAADARQETQLLQIGRAMLHVIEDFEMTPLSRACALADPKGGEGAMPRPQKFFEFFT